MDLELEAQLNEQIEIALKNKNLKLATDLCIDFLERIYTVKATKMWALRDFMRERIDPESGALSRFDKNLLALFDLRNEKVRGYAIKPRYVSPYFKDEQIEEFDNLYEEYTRREVGGRPTPQRFQKFIKTSIEDLFIG